MQFQASKSNSIKIVLQRDNPEEDYNITEVMIKDGSQGSNNGIPIQSALKAMRIQVGVYT